MAAIRVVAVHRSHRGHKTKAPEVAYFEQGSPNPHLVRLHRSLKRFVKRHGEPHHFKVHVIVSDSARPQARFFGPMGTALQPTLEHNGLSLYASRALSPEHKRDSAIAFPTLSGGVAQQVIISPNGQVDSHPVLVEAA